MAINNATIERNESGAKLKPAIVSDELKIVVTEENTCSPKLLTLELFSENP